MSQYELIYVLPAKLEAAERQAASAKVDKLITEAKGNVINHNEWLSRKLAYPINHIRQGIYMLAQVNLPAESLSTMNRELRLDENIMRYQLVKAETRAARPSARTARVLPQEAIASLEQKTEPVKAEITQEEVSPEQLEEKLEELLGDEPEVK